MPDTAQIAQAVAGLFDFEVGVGVSDPRATQPDLMAGEDALLGRAVAKRKQEFAAGRAAARTAMAAIGASPAAILPTLNQGPIWPEGLRGSISHSDLLCIAVVTRADCHIGIDAEPASPMPADLVQEVTGVALRQDDAAQRLQATRIFNAKEAAFKAQFPVSNTHFGFEALDIAWGENGADVVAQFTRAIAPFAKGDKLLGRHTLVAEHFVTAVSLSMDAIKGR